MLNSNNVQQLDIGIQTFNDSFVGWLQLRDNSAKAKLKLKTARKHGLRVSIDLLYNLPGQKVEQWKEDIKKALELEVESVDCYRWICIQKRFLAEKIATGELPPVGGLEVELKMYLEAYRLFKKYGVFPRLPQPLFAS